MSLTLFQDSDPVSTAATITLVAVINVAFMWRIMKPRISSMHTLNAKRCERFRIARDLHDSLSADLSQVAMLCDLALSSLSEAPEVTRRLNQIYDLAQTLARQVHDIVIELEQGQDAMIQVLRRLEGFAINYLEVARIRCEIQFPKFIPDQQLPAMSGKHLLLVVKELLHNVIKHSGATEVRLCARVSGGELHVLIEDNGRGMAERLHVGHGICNLHERMALIQGTIDQTSRPGHGTVSHLHLHLEPKKPAESTHENQSCYR